MNYSFTKTVLHKFAVVPGLLLLVLLVSKPLQAQERYPSIARISYVSGAVSYSRGDYPNEWDEAAVNVPFALGDRLYLPQDGRAELQLPSGNFIRLAPRSYFSALNLAYDVKQFYLGEGAASFNIRRLASDEVIEIDTPNVSVTFEQEGRYRVEVDEDGNSRIAVRRGRAIVAASGRQITIGEGELRVYGIDSPRYEVVAARSADGFDRWVAEREDRYDRSFPDAYRYASDQIIGVEDLSEHGRWEDIPEFGYAWTPSRVATGWVPFSAGRWFWQDPWGWTWISDEPWGWATCHYGRWVPYRSRWYWVPIRPRTRVIYAPAVVQFVRVRDHIGWFPLHPRDRFDSWWDWRGRPTVTQNITYVNRTYVTIVNQNTFISARNVTNNIVRDTVVVREASSVRVMEQPLPIPNRSSLRVMGGRERPSGQQPPATILSRAAVVRAALPPPPPTFEQKLPEIQKSQGKPVAPAAAAELALKNAQSNRRIEIRPAAVEASRADFAPRNPGAAGPAPQPLSEPRGKKLATREAPFDTKLPQEMDRREESPAQQERARQAPIEPPKEASRPAEPEQKQERREQLRQQQQQQEQERKEKAQQARELEQKQQQEQERLRQERQAQQQKERELRRQQQAEEARQKSLERQRSEQQQAQKQQQEARELERKQEQERRRQEKQLQQQKEQELRRQQQETQELERKQEQERRRQDRQIIEQKRKEQEQLRREQRPRELERKQQQEQARQKQPPPQEPRRKEQPEPRKQQPAPEKERRQE